MAMARVADAIVKAKASGRSRRLPGQLWHPRNSAYVELGADQRETSQPRLPFRALFW